MKLGSLFALGALLLSVGCASTATGDRTSALKAIDDVAFQVDSVDPDAALIVIRYPAFVDAGAKDTFYRQNEINAIGGTVSDEARFTEKTEQMIDSYLLKNTYFATALHDSLSRKLPENTVLLSPHVVKSAGGKDLYTEPVLSTERIPYVLSIDFTTYSFPDSDSLMNASATTFGDLVTPLVVIKTDHRAAPATHGVLASSRPLYGAAMASAQKNATTNAAGSLAKLNDPGANDSHDFIDYLSGLSATSEASAKNLSKNVDINSVDILPIERIRMDSEQIASLSDKSLGHRPFGDAYADYLSSRIVGYLNEVDAERAMTVQNVRSIAEYDYDVAHLYFSASENGSVNDRVQLAGKLLKAERNYLAGQSDGLVASMAESEFSDQLRDMIVAEQGNLEERREIARAQNTATAMAFLGATASMASAYSAGQASAYGDYSGAAAMQSNSSMMMGTAMMSMFEAQSKAAEGLMVGENFLSAMAPSVNVVSTTTVELVEGDEEVSAANFAELRDKTKALYARTARSMDVTAQACAFYHPAATEAGTWYGPCDDGSASSKGYGIAQLPDGTFVEYFGDANGGLADGVGLMVQTDGVAMEGNFSGGYANGIIEKSTPGKGRELVVVDDGTETGKADKDAVVNRVGV